MQAPSQFQLLRAKKGITGVGRHSALAQWKQTHTGVFGAPTPAQGGNSSVALAPAAALLSAACVGTLLVLRSQRQFGCVGCWMEEAWSSSGGIKGHAVLYFRTSRSASMAAALRT